MGKADRRRHPGDDDERRRRLLLATIRLFGERGYRHVSTDDLAAAANLSLGTVYAAFPGKQGCILAAYELLLGEARPRIAARIAAGASWGEQRAAAIEAVVAEILADPAAARFALLVVRSAGPEGAARHRQTVEEVASTLRQARAASGAAPAPAGYEDVAAAAAAALLAASLAGGERPDPSSLRRDLGALLAAGEATARSESPAR